MSADALDTLPEVLRLVAERLDIDAAVHLAATMGGETVKVPVNVEGSSLAARVGIQIATALSEDWPSIQIEIPNAAHWRSAQRRSAVIANPTKSVNELARELGITGRHVRGIRAAHRRSIISNAKRRDAAKRN